jgi:hypothetical protein
MEESGEEEIEKESRLDCTRMMNDFMNPMDDLLPLYVPLSNRPHCHYKFADKQCFPYQAGDLPCWAGRSSKLPPPAFSSTALALPTRCDLIHPHALLRTIMLSNWPLVVSQPRSSIPSPALHVKTSVAVIQHWANVPRDELHAEASSVP